jgi:hypothetical protein
VFWLTVALLNAILPPAATCQSGADCEEGCAAAEGVEEFDQRSAHIMHTTAPADTVLRSGRLLFPMAAPSAGGIPAHRPRSRRLYAKDLEVDYRQVGIVPAIRRNGDPGRSRL